MLADRDRVEEEPGRVGAYARAKQVIDLNEDRVWDEEVASKLGDQRGGQRVGLIAAVGGRDERASVGDDPHPSGTGTRK